MFSTFGKAAMSSVFTTTVLGLSSRRWQPLPQETGNLFGAGHLPHEGKFGKLGHSGRLRMNCGDDYELAHCW